LPHHYINVTSKTSKH